MLILINPIRTLAEFELQLQRWKRITLNQNLGLQSLLAGDIGRRKQVKFGMLVTLRSGLYIAGVLIWVFHFLYQSMELEFDIL
jgi:hypothetical protein